MCHRWFTRGQRPPGLCSQRHAWARLFAAVRPATGQDFALVPPEVSTRAMQAFLDRFAATLVPAGHAVLVLDQAGWHKARALRVPDNVALVSLPPCSPDLNPIERAFAKLKEALRAAAARTTEALWAAVGEKLAAFPPAECARCLAVCGYRQPGWSRFRSWELSESGRGSGLAC